MIWRISTRECGSSPLTRGKPGRRAGHTVARGLIPAHAGKTSGGRGPRSGGPAHPRSRGENFPVWFRAVSGRGSSPLTRGKHQARSRGLDAGGLIPAHAGKTRSARRRRSATRAHPRSRGENRTVTLYARGDLGSSPLTRGKHDGQGAVVADGGLIPAHAGKTFLELVGGDHGGAHPRSRGENFRVARTGQVVDGSSPLTRGKLNEAAPSQHRAGLIPAHAGKTPSQDRQAAGRRAHPRSRGENPFGVGHRGGDMGSSPLTRGKRGASRAEDDFDGLIPAHAGKTRCVSASSTRARAHPRSRGENTSASATNTLTAGSSPLTRGKLSTGCGDGADRGLIPAHAGKTSSRNPRCGASRAHPRSRGENSSAVALSVVSVGSSPLTRGKLVTRAPAAFAAGLIPAHAGKTQFVGHLSHGVGAHPRSRGENGTRPCCAAARWGSSPLTRGKRLLPSGIAGEAGSSPLTRGKPFFLR
mgnify:CR=1 FL=1